MSEAGAVQVLLSVAEAAALGERALQRIGYSTEEARVIAAHVVESELMGYPALGLTRVLTIAEHPRTKQPRKAVNIVRETPVSALVDCGNYVGMYAIHRVAEIAIGKARTGGFAVVGAHNTFLSGRNAYYLDMIARFGFVGVHLASGQPVVAPLGGSAPAFGTNPIAFGIPQRQLDELVSRVKSVRRQPGAGEIRIPSERAYAERERRLAKGIALERVLYDRICALKA